MTRVLPQLLTVLSNAKPGQDDDFNRWYDEIHVPDVLEVPGILSCRRYRLANQQMRGVRERPYEYLAVYEIQAEDPKAVADDIVARTISGEMVVSPSLDFARLLTLIYEPWTKVSIAQQSDDDHQASPSRRRRG